MWETRCFVEGGKGVLQKKIHFCVVGGAPTTSVWWKDHIRRKQVMHKGIRFDQGVPGGRHNLPFSAMVTGFYGRRIDGFGFGVFLYFMV